MLRRASDYKLIARLFADIFDCRYYLRCVNAYGTFTPSATEVPKAILLVFQQHVFRRCFDSVARVAVRPLKTPHQLSQWFLLQKTLTWDSLDNVL